MDHQNNDVKKDHSIGAGTGATAGVVSGALIGAAAGPIGAAVGAVIGGIGGAKAGDAIAEKVNPTEYDDYWATHYKSASYYQPEREWEDYAPAYGVGYHARNNFSESRFEDIEDQLEAKWDQAKCKSRLAWNEARDAVRDGRGTGNPADRLRRNDGRW